MGKPMAPGLLGRFGIRLPAIVGGGLWTLSAKFVSQIAQLATFVIAARVLTPTEFGFFAFSSAIAILLIVIAEGGWAEFVMKAGDRTARIHHVATLSLISGIALTCAGLAISAAIYFLFDKRWEGSLLALFSCCALPAALATTYDGSLVYHGRLQAKAIIRIAAEMAGLVMAVLGLAAGWNVLALVAGRLAMQLVLLCGSVAVVPRLPRYRFRWRVAAQVLEFSRHIVISRLVLFVRSYSGTLALGSFLGLAEAGYYRAAERIVASLSELIGEPARMLGWIVFRRASDRGGNGEARRESMRVAGIRLLPLLLSVSAPVYLGLALVSHGLVEIVLGEAWAPAALVVTILAIRQLLVMPVFATEPLLAVAGQIRYLPRLAVFNGLTAVVFVVAFAPLGLVAVALGQCLAALVTLSTNVWLQGRHGGLDWFQILRKSGLSFAAAALMAVGVMLFDDFAHAEALQRLPTFGLKIVTGVLIYVATLLMLGRLTGQAILSPLRASRHAG